MKLVLPRSVAEVGGGVIRAGGTDLQERLHAGITVAPSVVDLRDVPGLDALTWADGLSVGARVRIADLATHPDVVARYPGLAAAAGGLATPHIRAIGTVGGNLCQTDRCWYYRNPGFHCLKKGGDRCLARAGDHSRHVCYDLGACAAPHPSTLAVAFLAFDATCVVSGEERALADLYGGNGVNRLREGELLTEVRVPPPAEGEASAWVRIASRSRAEWPIVEVVARLHLEDGAISSSRIALGGVANRPLRALEAEAALRGRPPGAEAFAAAGKAAADRANPLPMTGWKVPLVAVAIEDALARAWEATS